MHPWSLFLNLCSLALFCWGILRFFFLSRQQRLSRRLLRLTLAVVGAVFLVECARLAADGERFFPSGVFIDTMQVFSLDAGYEAITGGPRAGDGILAGILYWYRAVVFTVAPIVGGAVIYDVLAGISPELRLLAVRRRRLMIFSELNERSILLARDILDREAGRGRPAIVFTDCYSDGGEEDSELLVQAKDLHAVCLQEDLLHCGGFRYSRACCFFLIDQTPDGELDDAGNLVALEGLLQADRPRWKPERGCVITLFSDHSEALENVRAVKHRYDTLVGDKRVTVRVVRDKATACCLHLDEAPLFRDLEPGQGLDVVIFGRGPFAREMFSTVFWQGQMLDHPLRIAMVYPPSGTGDGDEPELATALRRFSPELLDSCKPGHECLRLRPGKEDPSPIYASLCFVEADPRTAPIRELLTAERVCQYGSQEPFRLAQASRFLVMGDSDEENVALGDELRRTLSLLKGSGKYPGKKTVSLLVQNSDTSRVVSERFRDYGRLDETRVSPDMLIFGTLEDRFRWESVAVDGADLVRLRQRRGREAELHSLKDVSASRDDLYNDWSRVARAFHTPVKMYCAGVRDGDELERKLAYQQAMEPLDQPLVDRLRWLEHRRWCAFLRSLGFSRPPKLYETLCRVRDGSLRPEDWRELCFYAYKNIPARLHPCLVECVDYNNTEDDKDLLDYVSDLRSLVKKGQQAEEGPRPAPSPRPSEAPPRLRHPEVAPAPLGLKLYDSPYGENGPRLTAAELPELARRLNVAGENETAQTLLQRFPLLAECGADEGEYWLDLVLQVLRPEKGGQS